MISPEQTAEIRRLYFGERWKIGTIVAQLGVHADTVSHAIGTLGPAPERAPRPNLLDPYKPFIHDTLERYPRLRSTRLLDMICQRGFTGSDRTLRRYVRDVRPTPRKEVFLRVERLPGEQAQVDWGHVGKLRVPGGERALWFIRHDICREDEVSRRSSTKVETPANMDLPNRANRPWIVQRHLLQCVCTELFVRAPGSTFERERS